MVLSDLEAHNKKKEVNCIIVEDAELKILVKIIRKYTRFFRKKSNTYGIYNRTRICFRNTRNECFEHYIKKK